MKIFKMALVKNDKRSIENFMTGVKTTTNADTLKLKTLQAEDKVGTLKFRKVRALMTHHQDSANLHQNGGPKTLGDKGYKINS